MQNVLFLKLPSEKDVCASVHDEHKEEQANTAGVTAAGGRPFIT